MEDELQGTDASLNLHILDILDSVPFYVLLIDEDHYILQANRAVKAELGMEPKDIIGKYCPKVIHGVDGPFDGCPLEESIEKERAIEREVFDEKSGRWLLSAIYPIRGLIRNGKRIFFHMVTDITDRKQAEKQLSTSHERLRNLSMHLETVREEERKNIAHDLHDETSQVVASLNAFLEAVIGTLPVDANNTKVILRKAQALSINILDQISKLIYELHPPMLDDLGLVASIRWLIDNSLKAAGIKVDFKTVGRARRLPRQLETTVFRVVQEALSNIVRHASAKNAGVGLHFRKSIITVDITDDGRGFDVEEAMSLKDGLRGFGLIGMKERIELANGTFNIQTCPGGGSEINIEIPFNLAHH